MSVIFEDCDPLITELADSLGVTEQELVEYAFESVGIPLPRTGEQTMREQTHELKTWPEFFQAVIDGRKKFELRKNDRNFQVGDKLILREYVLDINSYTGRVASAVITYILPGGQFGLNKELCVLSLAKIYLLKETPEG